MKIYHYLLAFFSLSWLMHGCTANTPPFSAPPADTADTQDPLPPSYPTPYAGGDFLQWKAQFRERAIAQGFAVQHIDRLLGNAQENRSVVAADRKQPEFGKRIWEYLETPLAPTRIDEGRRHYQAQMAFLQYLERQYGVPAEILTAIWGVESSYGKITGKNDLASALATLAYEGRRREFAEQQLIALLRLLENGDVDWHQLNGSWAGGMGQTQFIPTTYWQYAVDGDGDGRRNLWNTRDALASAANYLSQSGWIRGLPWGYEVALPAHFDYALVNQSLPLAQWQQYGISRIDGQALPHAQAAGTLWLPAGHQGPALLLTPNFRVIRVYNNSANYALGVALLGDRIAGRPALRQPWPQHSQALSHTQVTQLQTRLTALGYDTQGADGVIGEKTREAFRAWQAANGQIPDGFVSLENARPLLP